MGIWDWFGKSEKRDNKATTAADLLKLRVTNSDAGVSVDQATAMQISAVNACVRVIGEDIAGLPFFVYQRNESGRTRRNDHPAYRLLHSEPNDQMTAFTFRECLMVSVLLYGNGYAFIEKKAERPIALWPLLPDRTRARRQNGQLVYDTVVNKQKVTLRPDQILHIPGLSFDGISGKSVIEQAANVFGIALAADRFGAKFFGQGTALSGYLRHPAKLGKDTIESLKTSWRDNYQGIDGAHGTPILEEGMEFIGLSVPPEQAQFLETRRFQHNEICRLFRVSPTKAGDLTKSAYNTLEHQSIDHVRSCLRPWAIKFEQEGNRKLFSEQEKADGHYCELNFDALLRGDTASQDNSFAKGIQFGWYSVNDVREYKNLNKIDGGDIYLSPLNMTPAAERATLDETPVPPKEKDDNPDSTD